MRIVVVGAGVIGLLTAVECVRAGAEVDLVDRGDIPSPMATSYDVLRAVRCLHRGDPALTRAAARLDEAWSDIERWLGAAFYRRAGTLTAMPPGDVERHLALLTAVGAEAEALTSADLAERYPGIGFEAGDGAVFEPAAGPLLADQALLAMAGWLSERPQARLRPRGLVTRIEPTGVVRLADGSTLAGDGVVVAAGPWSRELLPPLPGAELVLKRQTILSYEPGPDWCRTPVVLGLGESRDAWLIPPAAGRPMRLSSASACRTVLEMTDRQAAPEWRDHLTGQFGSVLTDFDPAAVTGAADGYYLTDRTGGGPLLAELDGGVWAYAACGGMSFKFAPPVAEALADRVMGRPARPTGLRAVDEPLRPARPVTQAT